LRIVLIVLIALESTGLLALAVAHPTGALDEWRREPPSVPVFRPPIYDAAIGDLVLYQRRDRESGEALGYLEYAVETAVEYKGSSLGRQFLIRMTRTDARGRRQMRKIMVQPRLVIHGFLPPRFEEDDSYPAGARPVIKSVRTREVALREGGGRSVPGFLLEAVLPRESLTEVKERYWIAPEVPVFGVARWERGDEVLVVHRAERPR